MAKMGLFLLHLGTVEVVVGEGEQWLLLHFSVFIAAMAEQEMAAGRWEGVAP
jgi:hypothetical protein